ncbi:MAG: hypothetical protein IKH24_00380 [Bacteroidales bacterium]|nr:hypothetical protein [Bacteroidales bacterium]
MTITLYRPSQIGGCITKIESSKGTTIFVDLGHNLPRGEEDAPDEYASAEAVEELTRGAKAIFFTHMHGDHIDLLKYVPDGIELYLGPLAANIMTAKYTHMSSVEDWKETCRICLPKLEASKKYHKGRRITIDNITVTPYQVSHSSVDSYMLKIECDGKTILHTGDFRGHGYMGEGIFKVIDKYHIAGHVDVLITEGTNIDRTNYSMQTEAALKEDFKDVLFKYKNTFILCSSTDADRLESIFCANMEGAKRPFIVDSYQKYLISLISEQAEEGRCLYRINSTGIYGYNPKVEKMVQMMKNHGFVMIIRNSIKFQGFLDGILPFCKPEETCLVYSMFHGYIDKKNPAFNKSMHSFIEQFRDNGCTIKDRLHTSGHASKQDLVRLCQQVNPHVIIPIHKDPNSDFKSILSEELARRVCDGDCCKDGVTILFDPKRIS